MCHTFHRLAHVRTVIEKAKAVWISRETGDSKRPLKLLYADKDRRPIRHGGANVHTESRSGSMVAESYPPRWSRVNMTSGWSLTPMGSNEPSMLIVSGGPAQPTCSGMMSAQISGSGVASDVNEALGSHTLLLTCSGALHRSPSCPEARTHTTSAARDCVENTSSALRRFIWFSLTTTSELKTPITRALTSSLITAHLHHFRVICCV